MATSKAPLETKTKSQAALEQRTSIRPKLPFASEPKRPEPQDHATTITRNDAQSFEIQKADSTSQQVDGIKNTQHDKLDNVVETKAAKGTIQSDPGIARLKNWKPDFTTPDLKIHRKPPMESMDLTFLSEEVFANPKMSQVLVEGLKKVNEIRPKYPIRFLGNYLMDNCEVNY